MKKTLLYSVLIIGMLGFITLIPGVVDGIIYNYFRFANGDVIVLDEQCYGVPDHWIIDSVDNHNQKTINNLRSKVDDRYVFSSILSGNENPIPEIGKLKPIKKKEGVFAIYELNTLPAENSVRYWSYIVNHDLIIMGTSTDILEELSLSIKLTDC